MPDLTRDHPAVDAAARAVFRWLEDRELETDLDGTVYMLNAALPHLTVTPPPSPARYWSARSTCPPTATPSPPATLNGVHA